MEQSQSLGQRSRLLLRGGTRGFKPSPFERVLLLALLVGTALGGYNVYAKTTDLNAVPPPAPTYLPAFRNTLSSTVTATGTVQSSQQVTLTFGSSGKIQSFLVKLGDQVKAGQELAKIDDTELRQALKSAESALASASARYTSAVEGPSTADRTSAQQTVLNAQGQVATSEQSLADLLAKPTTADLTTAQQGLLSAQTALQSAKDALRRAQDQANSAGATLNDARISVDTTYSSLLAAYNSALAPYLNCSGSTAKPPFPSLPAKGTTAAASPALGAAQCSEAGLSAYNSGRSGYDSARTAYNSAVTSLSTAQSAVSDASKELSGGSRERAIQSAELGLQTAQQKQAETAAGAKASEIEAARRGLESAKASLASAQARYDDLFKPPAPDVILPLQNAIDQAQAEVETARKNLAAATITAPFDGQISQVTGEVGTQVSATTAVFILLNPNVIRIDANVDQADVSNIKAGQNANVTFDALPGRSYQAQVAALGLTPTITQGVVTYVVTLSVDTSRLPQGTPVPAPGMTGSISVTTSRTENALVVPTRAIKRSGRTATVTVKTPSGTEQRTVTTGATNGTLIQVLTGLTDGEEVLVSAPATSTSTTSAQGGQQQQFFTGPTGGGGTFVR